MCLEHAVHRIAVSHLAIFRCPVDWVGLPCQTSVISECGDAWEECERILLLFAHDWFNLEATLTTIGADAVSTLGFGSVASCDGDEKGLMC